MNDKPEDTLAIWKTAEANLSDALAAVARAPVSFPTSRPYDAAAVGESVVAYLLDVMQKPQKLAEIQIESMREWTRFWMNAWQPQAADVPPPVEVPRSDRRFKDERWTEVPYFRTIRDHYLIAVDQMRRMVGVADGIAPQNRAMVKFLLEQYLESVAPTNFATTNPEVLQRTVETGGANLVSGFANLLQDVASGKQIVTRRSSGTFTKGETIAATPGSVVFQNHLFQLIQYDPQTPEVDSEPLLYVPPLVNKYYMIDLQPRSSLVRWLVEQGRTVFVVSWVDPDQSKENCAVEDYIRDGVVEALGAVRQATGSKSADLFGFCLGGTLVAAALAYLAAKGRADEVNTATLIGSMVDFADMRDWSAFVNEAHLGALEKHLDKRGFIESTELQQLFSAMRANDLIWSSVVNHYLLDRDAPQSDLLYWFEDGSRIPAAFLKSYNRAFLAENRLAGGSTFVVDDVAIDLGAVRTPVLVIALKDDHVSAWEAVYAGVKHFGGETAFVLGGSGHNAGVINPPEANKHGYWTNAKLGASAADWLQDAQKHGGSWWPIWVEWLGAHASGAQVPARVPGAGELAVIEPAPGSYAGAGLATSASN